MIAGTNSTGMGGNNGLRRSTSQTDDDNGGDSTPSSSIARKPLGQPRIVQVSRINSTTSSCTTLSNDDHFPLNSTGSNGQRSLQNQSSAQYRTMNGPTHSDALFGQSQQRMYGNTSTNNNNNKRARFGSNSSNGTSSTNSNNTGDISVHTQAARKEGKFRDNIERAVAEALSGDRNKKKNNYKDKTNPTGTMLVNKTVDNGSTSITSSSDVDDHDDSIDIPVSPNAQVRRNKRVRATMNNNHNPTDEYGSEEHSAEDDYSSMYHHHYQHQQQYHPQQYYYHHQQQPMSPNGRYMYNNQGYFYNDNDNSNNNASPNYNPKMSPGVQSAAAVLAAAYRTVAPEDIESPDDKHRNNRNNYRASQQQQQQYQMYYNNNNYDGNNYSGNYNTYSSQDGYYDNNNNNQSLSNGNNNGYYYYDQQTNQYVYYNNNSNGYNYNNNGYNYGTNEMGSNHRMYDSSSTSTTPSNRAGISSHMCTGRPECRKAGACICSNVNQMNKTESSQPVDNYFYQVRIAEFANANNGSAKNHSTSTATVPQYSNKTIKTKVTAPSSPAGSEGSENIHHSGNSSVDAVLEAALEMQNSTSNGTTLSSNRPTRTSPAYASPSRDLPPSTSSSYRGDVDEDEDHESDHNSSATTITSAEVVDTVTTKSPSTTGNGTTSNTNSRVVARAPLGDSDASSEGVAEYDHIVVPAIAIAH